MRLAIAPAIGASLVPVRPEHAFSLALLAGDPCISKWANVGFIDSVASAADFIARRMAEAEKGSSVTFALIAWDTLIGCCGLHSFSTEREEAEIAFWIGSPYQNRGFGSEVCCSLVGVAARIPTLSKLKARCFSKNGPAIRVLQKCGFIAVPSPPSRLEDKFTRLQLPLHSRGTEKGVVGPLVQQL